MAVGTTTMRAPAGRSSMLSTNPLSVPATMWVRTGAATVQVRITAALNPQNTAAMAMAATWSRQSQRVATAIATKKPAPVSDGHRAGSWSAAK